MVPAIAGCGGDMVGRQAQGGAEPRGAIAVESTDTSGNNGPQARIGSGAAAQSSVAPGPLRNLANARETLVGAGVAADRINDSTYVAAVVREFNYVTPENEMKWEVTEPRPGAYAFGGGDDIAMFAKAHGLKVKGHTLVWHSQLPGWTQSLVGRDALEAMTNHIRSLVDHYKGYVTAWDVVNEALADDAGHPLRKDVWSSEIGESYIARAFTLAHQADPNALLFYNDYGIESAAPGSKGSAMLKLVTGLVKAGVPINGVGFQAHMAAHGAPTTSDFADVMKRVTDLGLLVNISEMDVNVCDVPGTKAEKFAMQKRWIHDVAAACFALGRSCHAVTVWGVTDRYSWLNYFSPCGEGKTGQPWGLLLDDEYAEKPAWEGMFEALSRR